MFGGGAAGDLLRVGQRAALHLRQDALLVQRRFQKASVAVELHQVEDLPRKQRCPVTHGTGHLAPKVRGGARPHAQQGLFPKSLIAPGVVAQAPLCLITLITRQPSVAVLMTSQFQQPT